METINERVQKVLKASSLTQSEFAEKIGIKQGSLSLICSGKSGIGDRTIADICRVFGVDLIWLRTGAGEMFKQKTREEALAEILPEHKSMMTTEADCFALWRSYPMSICRFL